MANLTSKELGFIEDQLSAEMVLIKKYQSMSGQTNDTVIKQKCDSIANKHQQHFNCLLGHLN